MGQHHIYDLDIQNQPCLDMVRPEISTPAIIGFSVLIAVYLFMFIRLCVLNITQGPWVDLLNAYAISKMTAVLFSSSSSDIDRKIYTWDR